MGPAIGKSPAFITGIGVVFPVLAIVLFASCRGHGRTRSQSQTGAGIRKGTLTAVTELHGGMPLNPAFSPDGRTIVFDWWPTTTEKLELHLLNLVTREISRVAEEGCEATWAPKGNLLAYVSQRRVWIQDISSGAVRRLTVNKDSHINSEEAPSWSPDGKWIAYYGIGEGQAWLCVASVSNRNSRPLGPADTLPLQSPEWSPNSEELCYSRGNRKGVNLWKASLSVGVCAPFIATGDLERFCPARWSPLRSELVYVRRPSTDTYEIHLTDAKMHSDRILVRLSVKMMQDLTWSPDGRRIAFVAGDDVYGYKIRAYYLTSRHVVSLTTPMAGNKSVPSSLSWAHDSSRLAFVYNGNVWLLTSPRPDS